MEAFNYLNENLNVGSANVTEQALRMAVEDRELALNQQYLEQFENVGLEIFFNFSLLLGWVIRIVPLRKYKKIFKSVQSYKTLVIYFLEYFLIKYKIWENFWFRH